MKLHHCPLLLSKLRCRCTNDNNGSGRTKLSLPGSLNHLAFGWELTGRMPAYLQNVCDEREAGSHLSWPIMNRGQMNGFRGQSGKHLAMVIAAHTIYASQPEEWFPCVCGFRSLKPLCNCKKSRINHPPVTCIFYDTPLIIFTCPPAQGVRAHGNNPAAGTDSVHC